MSWLRKSAAGIIIYLGRLSPAASSNLPKAGGPRQRFRSVLLRMGFTCAPSVAREAVVSYTALPPLPSQEEGGSFLLHFPWSRLHRTLSGILPCEARTFLICNLSAPADAITCLTCVFPVYYFLFLIICLSVLPNFR